MTNELEGIDEGVSPIEKWHPSMLAHEAAMEDKRLPPEVEDHPDGHKSTKQQAQLERSVT
jgi:hypothetical protein